MNLNEYGIVRGGLSFTKLDENAHKHAKVFAQSKNNDLTELAIVTKTVRDFKFLKPIECLNEAIFHLDSAVRYDKNGDISVPCSLRDKDGVIAVRCRLVFALVAKQKLLSSKCCTKRKKKSKIKE